MNEQQHTQEPWGAFKMSNLKTKEEMIAYLTKCVNEGGDEFFFVSSDDDKDICHTGNGKKSFENAKRIVQCVNLCAGLHEKEIEEAIEQWKDREIKEHNQSDYRNETPE